MGPAALLLGLWSVPERVGCQSALLSAAVLPGTGRDPRFRLSSEPDDRGHPILGNGRIVGHSEFFWEAFNDAVNVLSSLMVSPRDFASSSTPWAVSP